MTAPAQERSCEPQMIRALAAIDEALGLPADGCNSLAQTLAAIRALQAKAEIAQALARTTMAGMGPDPHLSTDTGSPDTGDAP
jgi:hypothetical protein